MARIKSDRFLLSEKFYSIQGEGKTTGYPSYFIRLSQCNLTCGCSSTYVNNLKKLDDPLLEKKPGSFKGDLHEDGKATWTCDTIPVWIKYREEEFHDIIDQWKHDDLYNDIKSGLIHIIWTGGEPLIQQDSIVEFMRYWQLLPNIKPGELISVYNEIETNGTLYINDDLFNILNQINCSPKLSNSGQMKSMRINEKSIKRIMDHPNYQFKFVISTEDDIFEMFDTYINPFNIPLKNVVCMPGLDNRDDFFERTKWVMEMAKKYKFIGLSRMHVASWNQLTGV
jgi:7-carboxy-7-deazaguanine synthase